MYSSIDCPLCQGEGKVLAMGAPLHFSNELGTYMPNESEHLCPDCWGEGTLEVCAGCQEPLQIVKGKEVCACDELELPKAA